MKRSRNSAFKCLRNASKTDTNGLFRPRPTPSVDYVSANTASHTSDDASKKKAIQSANESFPEFSKNYAKPLH